MNDIILEYGFLAGDLVLVFIICQRLNRYWKLPVKTLFLGACLSLPVGLLSCKVMKLVESGSWKGISFYGAVLIAPFIMVLLGLVLKTNPKTVLDIGALVASAVLPLMKIQCLITGCCFGRIIRRLPNGRVVRFPSQAVEMICGIVLTLIIIQIEKLEKQRGYVYAWFLLLYGASRFFLNMLRQTSPFIFGMSAGCFWSLISVGIGGTVLFIKSRKSVN